MKRTRSILLSLILVFCALPITVAVNAEGFTSGSFTYEIDNGNAVITDCDESVSGEVVIPDTLGGCPVTEIRKYAFQNCSQMTSIKFADSITRVETMAFDGCTSLTGVYADSLVSWMNIEFVDMNPLLFAGNLYVNGELLTELTVPYDVYDIKEWSFSGCTSITSVALHEYVSNIGHGAFYQCTSLTDFYIPDLNLWFNYTFYNDMGPMAYAGPMGNLHVNGELVTDLYIPDGVSYICDSAFMGFTSIESVHIPETVFSIGNYAFANCRSLQTVEVNGSETIGEYAFYNCGSLKSVSIPANLKVIGVGSFTDTPPLKNVYITDLAAWCDIDFFDSTCNPLSMAGILYVNGQPAVEVFIPEGVTAIKPFVFNGCDNMEYITLPDSVESIGEYAFNYSMVRTVTVGTGLKKIDNFAFSECQFFESINIPDGAETIGLYAFNYCNKLLSLEIPDSVTDIRRHAFNDCDNLVLKVKENSTAHTYAVDNDIEFVLLPNNPQLSANNDLASLKADNATLSPSFSADIISYTASVPFGVSKLNISATAADGKATVEINSPNLVPGGTTDVTVTVTAENGEKKTYTVAVKRAKDTNYQPSDNNKLSSLAVSGFKLSPSFDADTVNYTVLLPYETDKITVNAVAADKNASVEIQGDDSLAAGRDNTVKVICTAENGDKKEYIIIAKRAAAEKEDLDEKPQEPVDTPEDTSTPTETESTETESTEADSTETDTKPEAKAPTKEKNGNGWIKYGIIGVLTVAVCIAIAVTVKKKITGKSSD